MTRRFLAALAVAALAFVSSASADNWTGGGSGGSTTITLGPGLSNSTTTYNPGTQTVTNGSTINLQLQYLAVSASCTVNTTCAGGVASDAGYLLTPTAASLTLTMPNPSSGEATQNFGYDGTHSYTLTTAGGTATIYGCGTTGTSITVSSPVGLISDGTNYQCVPNAQPLGNSGVTAGSYTNTNITVNAQGLITAASNGSGGSGGGIQLGSGYRAGRWYTPFAPGTSFATGNVQTAGSIYCYPAAFLTSAHVSGVNIYVNTLDAGGNAQVALYTNGSNQLPGTLLVSSASLSTAATGAVNATVTSTAIPAGPIWVCGQLDNATATLYSVYGAATTESGGEAFLGSAAALTSYAFPVISIYTTGTFGTWPASLGSASWTDNTTDAWGPWLQLDIASVP